MFLTFSCPKCQTSLEIDADYAGAVVSCPQCATGVTVPARRIVPGTTIGGFRIERQLGKGGMGEVYLARQLSMDRDVALKILPTSLSIRPQLKERFLAEVRIVARLEHPNIVAAYEAGEDAGVLYMAMAYVRGQSLADRLDSRQPLPEKEALRIVREIATALGYAWNEHRILHRDVKPANILLDEHGTAKLTDMGLSKRLDDADGMTASGQIIGTPNYMSPEQVDGRTDLDSRTDMYALGATFYHLITGQIPYEASSVLEVIRRMAKEPLKNPRELNPQLSEGSVRLLEKMLARRREQRHATWEELVQEIDAVLEGKRPSLLAAVLALLKGRAPKPATHAGETVPAAADLPTVTGVPPVGSPGRAPAGRSWLPTGVGVALVLVVLALWALDRSRQSRLDRPSPMSPPPAPTQPSPEPNRVADGTVAEPAAPSAPSQPPGPEAPATPGTPEQAPDSGQAVATSPPSPEAAAKSEAVAEPEVAPEPAGEESEARRSEDTKKAANDAFLILKANAGQLWVQGRLDEAIALLRGYAGPLAAETAEARTTLALEYQLKAEALRAAAARRLAEVEARLTTLHTEVGRFVLAGDFGAAQARLSKAATDPDLAALVSQVKTTADLLGKVAEMPDLLMTSFLKDAGKEVTIGLKKGRETLRIEGVGKGEILARKQVVTSHIARSFTIADLTAAEKLQRLGKGEAPELQIMRGLLALEEGTKARAASCFEASATRLGKTMATLVQAAK